MQIQSVNSHSQISNINFMAELINPDTLLDFYHDIGQANDARRVLSTKFAKMKAFPGLAWFERIEGKKTPGFINARAVYQQGRSTVKSNVLSIPIDKGPDAAANGLKDLSTDLFVKLNARKK